MVLMLQIQWPGEVWSNPSLIVLLWSLWTEVVVPCRVLFMCQINLFANDFYETGLDIIYISKLANNNQKWSEGSLFNSYYNEVYGRTLLLSLYCSTYYWSVPFNTKWWDIKYLVWLELGLNPGLPDHLRTQGKNFKKLHRKCKYKHIMYTIR